MAPREVDLTKEGSAKSTVRLPDLDSVVFTSIHVERTVDEDGIPVAAEGKLSLDLKATGAVAVKHSVKRNADFVVVKIDLDLTIVLEPNQSPVLACSIGMQGYFPCDDVPHKEQLADAIRKDMSIYHELAKTIYPLGLREIRSRVGDAGLPIPKLPLSFPIEDMRASGAE